jgi:hypothetical protein
MNAKVAELSASAKHRGKFSQMPSSSLSESDAEMREHWRRQGPADFPRAGCTKEVSLRLDIASLHP